MTTSNSYIIIVKDKKKYKKTGVDFGRLSAVQVPRGTAAKGEEVEQDNRSLNQR